MMTHNKKRYRKEVSEKLRKFSLILALALLLILALSAAAMAEPITTQAGKDTSYAVYGGTKTTAEAFADPAPHNDYFYLPGDPEAGVKIHSNYSENTDGCAACHFTHTAEGARLLQWDSIYKTCSACHDGSLGDYTYDVYAGEIGTTDARTFGGLFGAPPATMELANSIDTATNVYSLSNHMPNSYMTLSAAPGSTLAALAGGYAFDCASCHTPHGQGGNARILSPDPGKALISQVFEGAAGRNGNVNQFASILSGTVTVDSVVYKSDGSKRWIEGYPYNKITAVIDTSVANISDLSFSFDASGKLALDGADGTIIDPADYVINYVAGGVKLSGSYSQTGTKIVAVRVPGIFVPMKITGYMSVSEDVYYVYTTDSVDQGIYDGASNPKEGINAYCGACHGDYNTQGSVTTGSYDYVANGVGNHGSGYYGFAGLKRHQVGFKWQKQWTGDANYVKFAYPVGTPANTNLDTSKPIFTCLSCHFAHGTDNQYWLDYVTKINGNINNADDTLDTKAELKEAYGSSALKRLPNMSICENCHNKSAGNAKDTYDNSGTPTTYY